MHMYSLSIHDSRIKLKDESELYNRAIYIYVVNSDLKTNFLYS